MAQYHSRKLAKSSPGMADVEKMTATGPEYKSKSFICPTNAHKLL